MVTPLSRTEEGILHKILDRGTASPCHGAKSATAVISRSRQKRGGRSPRDHTEFKEVKRGQMGRAWDDKYGNRDC